jgi:XTP/dITP diphosphohydrolase
MSGEAGGARRVLLATANPHKVSEIQSVLGGRWHVVPLAPSVAETGSSFEENALQKAVSLRDVTGELTIADDSGIEIDALGGRPGVYSSRWTSEEDWVPKVLRELHGVGMPGRRCRYVCAAAVAFPDGTESVVRAEVEGYVAEHPRGESGFGYDPIMIPSDGDGRTFAEMESSAKHGISHRGRAFVMLEQLLRMNVDQAVAEADPATAEAPAAEGYEHIADAYHYAVPAGTAEDAAAAAEPSAHDGGAALAEGGHGQHADHGEHAAPADHGEQAEHAGHGAAAPHPEGAPDAQPAGVGEWADQTGGDGPVGEGGGGGGGGYPDGPADPAAAGASVPGGDQPGGGPAGGAGGDQASGSDGGGPPHDPESGRPHPSD